MRVFHVIDSLAYGGAELSLVSLIPELAQRGVTNSIFLLADRPTDLSDRATAGGAQVLTAPHASIPAQVQWLRRRISEDVPDLLHTTLYRADVVGRLASIGPRTPVVTSLVSVKDDRIRSEVSGVPGWKLSVSRRFDAETARRLTDQFHAVSEAVADNAINRLRIPRARITTIPRGRDPHLFRPAEPSERDEARKDLGIPGDSPVLLHVGRHEPAKGQMHLIEAFVAIREEVPSALLLMAGAEGTTSRSLRAAISREHLEGAVTLLGRRADIPRLMAAADVFVLPSLWEGLPNALIEAMACGVPVVATDIAPVREAGADAVELAAAADGQALASAVTSVLGDPARRAWMARAGRDRFLQGFTIASVADRMLSMYREVAAERPSGT